MKESELLAWFDRSIHQSEHDMMSAEFGFTSPLSIDYQKVLVSLKDRMMPENEHREICWAISECGLERIDLYSFPIKNFFVYMFLFCDKKLGGMGDEDQYLLFLVKAVYGAEDATSVQRALSVLQLIYDISSDRKYVGDDYFLLLSLVLVRIKLSGLLGMPLDIGVELDQLENMKLSEDDIKLLISGYDKTIDDWFGFLEKVEDVELSTRLFNVMAGT